MKASGRGIYRVRNTSDGGKVVEECGDKRVDSRYLRKNFHDYWLIGYNDAVCSAIFRAAWSGYNVSAIAERRRFKAPPRADAIRAAMQYRKFQSHSNS